MKDQVLSILMPNAATGYKVIKLSGWEGMCFVIPRTELGEIEKRSDINEPGIYFLFGEADESTNQKLYIGESERFFDRLQNHDKAKDFWNKAVIFTGGLNKANIKFLESVSTSEAMRAGRYSLENGNSPKENSLSEFDRIATQNYFKHIDYILTALEYPVFQKISESINDKTVYYLKGEDMDAKALLLSDGSLNVLKGSRARIRETQAFWGWSQAARKRFLEDGTLIKDEKGLSYVYTKDVLFKSPSAAAATTIGSPANGWTAWKDEKGNTLDENVRK